MDRADGQPQHHHRDGDVEPVGAAELRPRDREHAAQVVEGEHQHHDAEDALDVLDPLAGLGQVHREGAHREEERAEAEAVDEERRGAEGHALGRADIGQQHGEHRSGAGRGDEPVDEADGEGALVAGAADLGELVLQARGQAHVPGAEHARRHGDEEDGQADQHPGVGQRRAHGVAGQGADDPERREERRDAEHEGGAQQGALGLALGLPGAEDAHRHRDHRVDAGRQRRRQPGDEDEPQRQRVVATAQRRFEFLGETAEHVRLGDRRDQPDGERRRESDRDFATHAFAHRPYLASGSAREPGEPARMDTRCAITRSASEALGSDRRCG